MPPRERTRLEEPTAQAAAVTTSLEVAFERKGLAAGRATAADCAVYTAVGERLFLQLKRRLEQLQTGGRQHSGRRPNEKGVPTLCPEGPGAPDMPLSAELRRPGGAGRLMCVQS